MGKDRLEDYIKKEVYTHQSEVNTDEIWAGINQQKKRNRKIPFWIFLGLGFIVAAVLIGIVFMPISEKNTEINISESIAIENHEDENNKVLPQTDKEITLIPTNSTDLTASSEKGSFHSSAADLVNNNASSNRQDSNQDSNNKEIQSHEEIVVDLSSYLNVPIDHSENSITSSPTSIDLTKEIAAQGSNLPLSFPKLINPLRILNNERIITLQDLNPFAPESEPIISDWKWNVGLSSRIMGGKRYLQCVDTLGLLERRTNNEEFMESWGVGISVGLESPNGFTFTTGLTYQQINDRSILPGTIETKLNEKPFSYSIYAKEVQPIDQHRYNKIRMIDVPLLVGYKQRKGNWGFSSSGGINFNVIASAKGNIVGLSDFVNVEEENIFKSRVGYNLEMSGGVDYFFGDAWSLLLHPIIQYYPSSFTQNHSCVDQKYLLWGLNLTLSSSF